MQFVVMEDERMPHFVVCQKCGESLPASAAFCANCGTPLARASQGVRISLDTATISPQGQRPAVPSAPIAAPPAGRPSAPVPLPPRPSAPFQQPPTSSAPMPGIPRLTVPIPSPAPAPASRWTLLQQRMSRRTALVGLAGVSLALGGIGWLFGSQFLDAAASGPALDAPLGETLFTYRGHQAAVNDLSWSSLLDRIASASADGTAQVWDALTGTNVLIYRGHAKTAITGKPAALAVGWSPDGTKIASGGADGTAQVWDAGSGTVLFTYTGHAAAVRALAWSPDGTRIASGGDDGGLHVWDALTGKHAAQYSGQADGVTSVAWSPDGKQVASTGQDGTVQINGANSPGNVLLRSSTVQSGLRVNDAAWSPDSARMATCGDDGWACVWDATTSGVGVPVPINILYKQGVPSVLAVGWSPDGSKIASAGSDGVAQVWRAADGIRLFRYRGHDVGTAVHRLVWSSDSARVASAGDDKTVRVWSAR